MDERIFVSFANTLFNMIWETSNFLYVGMHKDLSKEFLLKHNKFAKKEMELFEKECNEIFKELYGEESSNETEVKESETLNAEVKNTPSVNIETKMPDEIILSKNSSRLSSPKKVIKLSSKEIEPDRSERAIRLREKDHKLKRTKDQIDFEDYSDRALMKEKKKVRSLARKSKRISK